MIKKIIVIFALLNLVSFVISAASKPEENTAATEGASDQKMVDFSLAGYNQRGKKSWEVKGNSADIFTDIVKLTDVNANVFGEEDKINLVADKGEYDKTNGKMHLQDNVVITTQTGGKLTTDSLDWDRASQRVTTNDLVKVEKENMKIDGKGLEGQPNLKKVEFKDNVQVEIKEAQDAKSPADGTKGPTIITCEGPLEIDYEKEVAVFNKNVKVDQKEQIQMYADKMEAYFDFKNKKILRVQSSGNVKIVKGDNVSYSDEANYLASDKKMTLTGRPRLVIYSGEKLVDAPTGN